MNETYEITITETVTHVVRVSANNYIRAMVRAENAIEAGESQRGESTLQLEGYKRVPTA
jgi:hypothetical protein